MTLDPMRGPPAIASGTAGELRIGGMKAGTLTTWRVVISPTTGKPTLFGAGRMLRFFAQSMGKQAHVALIPAPQPYRIGRPKPKTPKPFVLVGKIVEFSAGRITIAEGEIEYARG